MSEKRAVTVVVAVILVVALVVAGISVASYYKSSPVGFWLMLEEVSNLSIVRAIWVAISSVFVIGSAFAMLVAARDGDERRHNTAIKFLWGGVISFIVFAVFYSVDFAAIAATFS